jgi:hypothetical protein
VAGVLALIVVTRFHHLQRGDCGAAETVDERLADMTAARRCWGHRGRRLVLAKTQYTIEHRPLFAEGDMLPALLAPFCTWRRRCRTAADSPSAS